MDAAKERVKPVLFVSFLDKEILILEKDSEDIYQDLTKVSFNTGGQTVFCRSGSGAPPIDFIFHPSLASLVR